MIKNESDGEFRMEYTFAFWVMRVWLAVRALITGVEKFSATVNVPTMVDGYELSVEKKVYGLKHYHGMPEALSEKFASEPLLPGFLLAPYEFLLGPILILVGLTLLLGVASRISLLVMGLLYTSLSFGLILINQSGGIAWLAIHVIMVVIALVMVKHDRFTIMKRF